jgi:outer membrane protein assembly factor BamB
MANSGALLWQDSILGAKTVVIDGQQVIAIGADAIRAYKASNGTMQWQRPLASGTVIAAAEMKGNHLLITGSALDSAGAAQLLLSAYDVRNGHVAWENQSLPPDTTLFDFWRQSLSIHGTRAYVVATVGVMSNAPHPVASCLIRAYDREGGNLISEYVTPERCAANAVVAHGKQVILAGLGGRCCG